MIFIRAILYNTGFFIWTLGLGILGIPTILFGADAVLGLARFWARGSFWWLKFSVGLDYELRGAEHIPDGPAIWALKHQSAWDTLLLPQLLRRPAIVFKRELIFLPVIGWYMARARLIPVDRQGGASALRRMIAAAADAIKNGRPIAIFPEGTRVPIDGKLPYQPGVGALYTQLGVPLVPVALNSGLYWGKRAFMKRPGRILVQILPPIESGLPRRKALESLESAIESATRTLVDEVRALPVDKFVGNSETGR